MTQDGERRTRRPLLVNLAWAVVVVVLIGIGYVLSYAPVVKFMVWRDPSLSLWIDSRKLPIYKPVDWIIDNTPMYRPLFWWASLWGVGDDFEVMHDTRAIFSPEHRYLDRR
jgi:hypothetical protein